MDTYLLYYFRHRPSFCDLVYIYIYSLNCFSITLKMPIKSNYNALTTIASPPRSLQLSPYIFTGLDATFNFFSFVHVRHRRINWTHLNMHVFHWIVTVQFDWFFNLIYSINVLFYGQTAKKAMICFLEMLDYLQNFYIKIYKYQIHTHHTPIKNVISIFLIPLRKFNSLLFFIYNHIKILFFHL